MSNRGGQITTYLIVCIILWIIFSVLCWLSFTKAEDAKEQAARLDKKLYKAKKDLAGTEERLHKISNLVGFHQSTQNGGGLYADPATIIFNLDMLCSDDPYSPYTRKSLGLEKYLENYKIDQDGLITRKNSDEVKEQRRALLDKLLGIEYVRRIVTLEDAWTACAKKVDKLTETTTEQREKLTRLQKKYQDIAAESVRDIAKMHSSIEGKRRAIEELSTRYDEEIKKAEQARGRALATKVREKDKVAALIRQVRAQMTKYESELENLDERIKGLQAEAEGRTGIERWFTEQSSAKQPQESPDGEVIYVNAPRKLAYIDLGRREGVLKGMSFQVFRYGKGGVKNYKGKITIREVVDNMSKVGIVEITDTLNPIRVGDKIINRVYDRDKVKYFAIAGKLAQKYSFEQVSRMVKRIGAKIEQRITAKTDIVVLGEGFRSDALYQLAVERGIETMLEAEFLEYLGD